MKHICHFLLFCLPLVLSSCQVVKEATRDAMIESVQDPKSGAQVFVRENPGDSYEINVGGIVKARNQMRKEKLKKELEGY